MAGETEFCLLGPLVVRSGGVVLPVPAGKQRAVLAVLLLNAGRVVSLDELDEALWGADPPLSARGAVHNYVMRLRKALRDIGGSRISTLPHGYMITVDAGELDVAQFEDHLAAARTAARGGSWDTAATRAGAALSLWRGAPLEDVASELLAVREVPWLAEMRLQALEVRVDAELHCGRQGEVIGELRQLAAAHPLREHLQALLMMALYRDGRQAEALAAYQQARHVLIDELGTEPGAGLQQIQQQILSADPALVAPSPSAAAVTFSLPADTAAFTGRAGELDRVTAAVTGASALGGMVAIHAIGGMPGVGKTALAVHAAHELAGEFPDRQLFIDLHAHTPGHQPVRPEDALAELLAAAGVDPRFVPADLEGRAGLWRDKMAGQRALLVFDNAADSGQVAPLLPGAAGCLVLMTSRRHLGDLPGAVTPVPLDTLPPQEAANMFTWLAPRAAADPEGVAEVAGLAAFLPLAVSLLARVFARHPSWTLADLAGETRARLLTLTAENGSIAAAFDVSYRYLDPVSQRFFRLLGVHPGATTDAYAAAAFAGVSVDEAAGHLEALYGEGLLTETGYRRYGMHDLIRRYARGLAAAENSGDSEQALGRLLDYYQHTAAQAAKRLVRQTRPGPMPSAPPEIEVPGLRDVGQALAWARAERASLVACLNLATSTRQHARIVAHTAGLASVLRYDGPWAEAITLHAAAVDAARYLGDRLGEASALTDLGDARRRTGDFPGAAGNFEEALATFRDLGDRLGEANALFYLGFVWTLTGDFPGAAGVLDEALGIYRDLGDQLGEAGAMAGQLSLDSPGAAGIAEEVLGIYRDLGDRIGEVETRTVLGRLRYLAGDYLGAARFLEEALGIVHDLDLGGKLGEAFALYNLGIVRSLAGDYPEAAAALEHALRIWRDLGDRLGVANTASALGHVRRLTGDPEAAALLEEAVGIYRSISGRLCDAHALRNLGTVLSLTGDHPGAARVLAEALSIYRDLGNRHDEADTLLSLGTARSVTGDHLGAARVLAEALGIYRDLGNRGGEAETLNEQGMLHGARGDPGRAQGCHQQALDLARAIGSPRDEACALAGLGRSATAAGHIAKAEVLLQQAHQIFQRIGAAEARDVLPS